MDHLHRDLEAIVKRGGGAVVLKVILYLFLPQIQWVLIMFHKFSNKKCNFPVFFHVFSIYLFHPWVAINHQNSTVGGTSLQLGS